jgi:hypothetical protein
LIDFRYHLVSIVAVFLALAIGLVVGSTELRPGVAAGLQALAQREQQANNRLNTQNGQLNQQLAADNAFAQAGSAGLVNNLLLGQSVVLVLAPGADSQTVTGVTTVLRQAGATVTGQVVLQPQFFDTGSVTEQALSTAARGLAPPGVRLPRSSPDPQISGQQAAAQVISAAVVSANGLPTMTPQQSRAILSGFGREHFLQLNAADGSGVAALSGQATMAVVVIPGTVPASNAGGPFNLALVSFAQDLQEASRGAVLAGAFSGSGAGSAIDVASSGGAGIPLSTVDNADSAIGQIIVAQALRELVTGATPASYGARPGTVPSPAPSPVTSPSPSPSPSRKKKH